MFWFGPNQQHQDVSQGGQLWTLHDPRLYTDRKQNGSEMVAILWLHELRSKIK